MIRTWFRIGLAASFAILMTTLANAQAYPRQAIKLIVPFPAGGGVDIIARIISEPLAAQLGQPVIVDNRAGAGGSLGATAAAQAQPDGYTLLLGTSSTHTTNPSVQPKINYDPQKDFVPIVLISKTTFFLLTHPSLPAKSVEELIALARREPGHLKYGSYGVGSLTHLAAEQFNSMVNIETTHIPYRGSAPALVDLIAGRIDFVFDGFSALGQVKDGSLHVMATTGPKRAIVLDRPTMSEAGVAGYDLSPWYGLFAPAGTPKEIVDLLNSKINAILKTPQVLAALEKNGMEAVGGTADTLREQVRAELEQWKKLAREKNIQIGQ